MADNIQPPDNVPESKEGKETTGRTPSFGERLAERSQLVIYTLIVIVALVVLNVIAARHDKSWDLTKNKTHSLSNESIKIVSNLKQPVDFIYFDRQEEFGRARDFLQRYQRASNRVHVDYVDPVSHPDQARKYKIENYGTLVVQVGDRQELVNNLSEEDVTNALVRLLKGGRKIVYFLQGEGERDPEDSGRNGLSDLKKSLEDENFTVKTLVLAQNPKVPADAAALVVAGPQHPLLQPEIDIVSNYINSGGRALFMVGPESQGALVDYLQNSLNVKLQPDNVVVDTSGIGRLFGASELMPIVAHYDNHPITSEMRNVATLFPLARTVDPGNAPNAKTSVTPLLETSSASFAPKWTGARQLRLDQKTARKGPLTLAVAGTMTAAGAKPGTAESRFVVYGTPDFVTNQFLGFEGNRDLFLNTMNWLATQESFITIRPKAPENTPVNLSTTQMHGIMWAVLVIVPALIVVAGISVWWERRKA